MQWLRVAGDEVALTEDTEFVIDGKHKSSVRVKTSVVSFLLSRFFSAEHAAVGNEARAERINFSHCVFDDSVSFRFFHRLYNCAIRKSKAYFWNSLWHDEQPSNITDMRNGGFRKFVRRAHDEDGQAATSRCTNVFGETCSF